MDELAKQTLTKLVENGMDVKATRRFEALEILKDAFAVAIAEAMKIQTENIKNWYK